MTRSTGETRISSVTRGVPFRNPGDAQVHELPRTAPVRETVMINERTNRHATIWALCFMVALVEGYDLQSAGLAAPALAMEHTLNRMQLGWVFSSNTLGLLLGAALGGMLSDRIGRKAVLTGSLLTFGAFSIGTALTNGFGELVAMRFLTGVGLGAAFPNLIALVAEAGDPRGRVGRVTIVTAGIPLGGALAALFVAVAGGVDWKLIFHLGGVAPILLAAMVSGLMPRGVAPPLEICGDDSAGFTAALLGPGRAVRTLTLWTSSFFTLLVLYLLLNWLPTLMIARGVTGGAAMWAAFGFSAAGACGALLLGLLIARVVRLPLFLLAYTGLAFSLVALATATPDAITLAASAAGFFVIGAQFALYGLSADCYPAAVRGTGTGAAVAVGRLGAVTGPLLAGIVLGAGSDARLLLTILLPLVALAAAATVLLLLVLRGPAPDVSYNGHANRM